jgi:hypothetical protein
MEQASKQLEQLNRDSQVLLKPQQKTGNEISMQPKNSLILLGSILLI